MFYWSFWQKQKNTSTWRYFSWSYVCSYLSLGCSKETLYLIFMFHNFFMNHNNREETFTTVYFLIFEWHFSQNPFLYISWKLLFFCKLIKIAQGPQPCRRCNLLQSLIAGLTTFISFPLPLSSCSAPRAQTKNWHHQELGRELLNPKYNLTVDKEQKEKVAFKIKQEKLRRQKPYNHFPERTLF